MKKLQKNQGTLEKPEVLETKVNLHNFTIQRNPKMLWEIANDCQKSRKSWKSGNRKTGKSQKFSMPKSNEIFHENCQKSRKKLKSGNRKKLKLRKKLFRSSFKRGNFTSCNHRVGHIFWPFESSQISDVVCTLVKKKIGWNIHMIVVYFDT